MDFSMRRELKKVLDPAGIKETSVIEMRISIDEQGIKSLSFDTYISVYAPEDRPENSHESTTYKREQRNSILKQSQSWIKTEYVAGKGDVETTIDDIIDDIKGEHLSMLFGIWRSE